MHNRPMESFRSDTRAEIAAVAARLVVDEGMEYAEAKRRAARQLGLSSARTPLPDNAELEAAVRDHIAIFCADTQPGELKVLRELALEWMERLARFSPHLCGAVWHGSATRHSDLRIRLYCDDPKAAEWALLDLRVEYHPGTDSDSHGEPVEALTLRLFSRPLQQWVLVHLLVHDLQDRRTVRKLDGQGRPSQGNADDVRALLAAPQEAA